MIAPQKGEERQPNPDAVKLGQLRWAKVSKAERRKIMADLSRRISKEKATERAVKAWATKRAKALEAMASGVPAASPDDAELKAQLRKLNRLAAKLVARASRPRAAG